jgi:hypothetical protein
LTGAPNNIPISHLTHKHTHAHEYCIKTGRDGPEVEELAKGEERPEVERGRPREGGHREE